MKKNKKGASEMVKEITSQAEFDAVMKSDKADNITWCPHCGRCYVIDYISKEKEMLMKWSKNRFSSKAITIQNALPKRNNYEREIMKYAWNGSDMLKCSENCTYPL